MKHTEVRIGDSPPLRESILGLLALGWMLAMPLSAAGTSFDPTDDVLAMLRGGVPAAAIVSAIEGLPPGTFTSEDLAKLTAAHVPSEVLVAAGGQLGNARASVEQTGSAPGPRSTSPATSPAVWADESAPVWCKPAKAPPNELTSIVIRMVHARVPTEAIESAIDDYPDAAVSPADIQSVRAAGAAQSLIDTLTRHVKTPDTESVSAGSSNIDDCVRQQPRVQSALVERAVRRPGCDDDQTHACDGMDLHGTRQDLLGSLFAPGEVDSTAVTVVGAAPSGTANESPAARLMVAQRLPPALGSIVAGKAELLGQTNIAGLMLDQQPDLSVFSADGRPLAITVLVHSPLDTDFILSKFIMAFPEAVSVKSAAAGRVYQQHDEQAQVTWTFRPSASGTDISKCVEDTAAETSVVGALAERARNAWLNGELRTSTLPDAQTFHEYELFLAKKQLGLGDLKSAAQHLTRASLAYPVPTEDDAVRQKIAAARATQARPAVVPAAPPAPSVPPPSQQARPEDTPPVQVDTYPVTRDPEQYPSTQPRSPEWRSCYAACHQEWGCVMDTIAEGAEAGGEAASQCFLLSPDCPPRCEDAVTGYYECVSAGQSSNLACMKGSFSGPMP